LFGAEFILGRVRQCGAKISGNGEMASSSVLGGQYNVVVPGNQQVNVVMTTNGDSLPPAVPGAFNLEVITDGVVPAGLPQGYEGVLVLSDNGQTIDMAYGNFALNLTGDPTVIGGTGNDTITAGNAPALITGGSGSDLIYGGNGPDTIQGGSGSDTIYGGAGPDTIYGGNGPDTIYGGNGPDTIYGGNGPDALYGGNGPDALYGGNGPDTIYGGNGPDTI
jgi:Ca2+-binding RTX toxin-like protein